MDSSGIGQIATMILPKGAGRSASAAALTLTLTLLGAAAAAQETAPPSADANPAPETKPAADTKQPAPRNLQPIGHEAVAILGKQVQGPGGENFGRVVDVLVDAENRPRAAVIDFGGFLGVGSRKIAVDWQLLQFRPENSTAPVLLNVSRAEVQAAPEYKPSVRPAEVVAPPPPPATPPPATAQSPAPADAGK